MLWDDEEALVEQELEAVVVHSHSERASLEVGSPLSHGLHKADELAFISCQSSVLRCQRLAEERQRSFALVGNGADPRARSITFDNDALAKSGNWRAPS